MLATFVRDLADHAADSLLGSDDFFSVVLGMVIKVGTTASKIDQFNECLGMATRECRREYQRWAGEPRRLYTECQGHRRTLAEAPVRLAALGRQVDGIDQRLTRAQAFTEQFASVGLYRVYPAGRRPSVLDGPRCLEFPVAGLDGADTVDADVARLRRLLEESPSLDAEDREYWLSILPELDADRRADLIETLETERRKLDALGRD